MGPCAVYLIWAIIVVIFLPVFISGIRKKSWSQSVVGGIPVAFVLLLILGIILRVHLSSNPDFVFSTAFGKLPDNNIKVIEHDYRFSTDSVSIYLKIKANREDFEKILRTGFQEKNKDRFEQLTWGPGKPLWFKPLLEGATEFYEKSPYKGYSSSGAYLSYNEMNSIAYFHGDGVD